MAHGSATVRVHQLRLLIQTVHTPSQLLQEQAEQSLQPQGQSTTALTQPLPLPQTLDTQLQPPVAAVRCLEPRTPPELSLVLVRSLQRLQSIHTPSQLLPEQAEQSRQP